MNRRKSETRTPGSVLFALIAAAGIAACGGVLHAYYKNRQVQTAREIDACERRIGQYQLDIETIRMRMDERLNRFAIRKDLESYGSSLRPIPIAAIERVTPAAAERGSVASADR
jgi:hypothetical protein